MKKLLFVLFFLLFLNEAESQNVSAKTLRQDSLITIPARPPAGKVIDFSMGKNGTFILTSDSLRRRIDGVDSLRRSNDSLYYQMNNQWYSLGLLSSGGSGTSKRVSPYAWYNWSAIADSQIVFESDTTFTVDSIRVIQAGASAVTVNFKRIRSGTPVDMLSANYSVTTSMTTASGLQNNSLTRNDQVWAVIRSITGTATYVFIQVCWH